MKKIFILSSLIFITPLWAQTYIQNVRNINDITASSYQITPGISIIAPGISITPPMWSRNLDSYNNVTNGELNPGNIAPKKTNNVVPDLNIKAPSLKEKTALVTEDNTQINPAQTIAPIPEKTTQEVAVVKDLPKPAIVSGSISNWNRTTQQEIEANAKTDIQEKYKAFLTQK